MPSLALFVLLRPAREDLKVGGCRFSACCTVSGADVTRGRTSSAKDVSEHRGRFFLNVVNPHSFIFIRLTGEYSPLSWKTPGPNVPKFPACSSTSNAL